MDGLNVGSNQKIRTVGEEYVSAGRGINSMAMMGSITVIYNVLSEMGVLPSKE